MNVFAQGEIYARKIDTLPDGLVPLSEKDAAGAFIISHSEQGNHHIIPAGGVAVMERTTNVPAGMRVLYAIVEKPTVLKQDAAKAHDPHDLDPGIYEMRIAREYNPFSEQVRRVQD